jgi:PTS system mannose-specific IIC component
MMLTNSFWNHRASIALEKGDYNGLKFNHYVGPQITQFLYRFVPTFLVVYFGSNIATNIISYFPVDSFVMRTLTALGGMLPAVGVAILLKQVTKKDIDIIQFLVGFTFIAAVKINMIALAILGAFFAYLHFKYSAERTVAVAKVSDVEEEL